MTLIICSGIHSISLTVSFLNCLKTLDSNLTDNCLIFPTDRYLAYSSCQLLEFLQQHYPCAKESPPLTFIAFSAGVVSAIATANYWQFLGGKIQKFIALDGWGMPLIGNFPIYRLSHDSFTHYSSGLISLSQLSFYASPAVNHLDLWRSPNLVKGWQEKKLGCQIYTNALDFINFVLL